jgi:hypothetical protein
MTRRKLDKLAEALGGSECPECGDDGRDENVTITLSWPEPGENPQPEWCSTCGRPTTIVITWDD